MTETPHTLTAHLLLYSTLPTPIVRQLVTQGKLPEPADFASLLCGVVFQHWGCKFAVAGDIDGKMILRGGATGGVENADPEANLELMKRLLTRALMAVADDIEVVDESKVKGSQQN